MEQPLLTIAIPTYNGKNTICAMLDLLLQQFDPRVEILISDNCSTDGTSELIGQYKQKYPFINHYRNEKNIGPDANFLQCMKLAKGKFVHLLSDDDVLIEGALERMLSYLEANNAVKLVYLYTKGFRGKYTGVDNCSDPAPQPTRDICTTDRKVFMDYAGYYWGFMSSFVMSKDRFDKIENPEQYFGSYWLQAYIWILCCTEPDDKVGVVAYPCVGAGIYVNVNNFDTAYVDGINYRKMLDFAVEKGYFDKKQLDKLYEWRIIFLGSHSVIKEKAAGIHKTSKRELFKCTWQYPKAWVKLYPIFLIPDFICKYAMEWYRKRQNMDKSVSQQRTGDVAI